MEQVNILKKRLVTAKCLFTKSSTRVQNDLDCLENSNDAPPKRQVRLAEEALDNLTEMRSKYKQIQQIAEALVEEINDQGDEFANSEEVVSLVNSELEVYEVKLDEFMRKNDEVILLAETKSNEEGVTTIQKVATDKNEWRAFKQNINLKPHFLEKESTHLDAKNFCEMFKNYILDGFQGDPKGSAIYIHLQPLLEITWWTSIVHRGVTEGKNLEEILQILMEESDARNPLHSRRIELLRIKKSGSHSDFLFNLEKMGGLIDFKSLTLDSLLMHLYLEQADREMAKVCQDILAKKPEGDLHNLRNEIKRIEASTWFDSANNRAKLAVAGSRYCADCDTSTHDKKDCWGPCVHCKRRNHRSTDCRHKPKDTANRVNKEEDEKTKLKDAAKKTAKNKKKNDKRKQDKKAKLAEKAEKADKAFSESVQSTPDSSDSEDSPVKANMARLNRVGMGMAKKAIFSLESELERMSEEEKKKFGDSVFSTLRAKTAKSSNNSPLLRATVYSSRQS